MGSSQPADEGLGGEGDAGAPTDGRGPCPCEVAAVGRGWHEAQLPVLPDLHQPFGAGARRGRTPAGPVAARTPEPQHARDTAPKRGASWEGAKAAPPSTQRWALCSAGSPEEVSCYWEAGMAACSRAARGQKAIVRRGAPPAMAQPQRFPQPRQGPERSSPPTRPQATKVARPVAKERGAPACGALGSQRGAGAPPGWLHRGALRLSERTELEQLPALLPALSEIPQMCPRHPEGWGQWGGTRWATQVKLKPAAAKHGCQPGPCPQRCQQFGVHTHTPWPQPHIPT